MFGLLGVNWATIFLAIVVYGIIRYFAKSEKSKTIINWSPLESIGITVAIYFVTQIVATTILYLIPRLKGWSGIQISNWLDKNIYGQFLLVLLIESLVVALLYYFLKRRHANFKSIGLNKPRWRDLAYIVLSFFVYFGSFIIILSITKKLIPSINTDQQQQIGFSNPSHFQLPLVFMSLVILPPITEELLVRGFLYSGLKKGLPTIWAGLITSLLFAAAHLQAGSGQPLLWSAAIDTFILSLVLVYLKEKTGGLAAGIGLHMLKNFVAFYSLFVLHLR